ncbi:MAG: hypothetical protein US22_C0049G0004, partial [candidate division TM6 bacterium GW2011_GWF2_36_6]
MQIIKRMTFMLLAGVLVSQSCLGVELKRRAEVKMHELCLQLEYCMNQKPVYNLVKNMMVPGKDEKNGQTIDGILKEVKKNEALICDCGLLIAASTFLSPSELKPKKEKLADVQKHVKAFMADVQKHVKAFMAAQKAYFWLSLNKGSFKNGELLVNIYTKVLNNIASDAAVDAAIFENLNGEELQAGFKIKKWYFESVDPLIISRAIQIVQAKTDEKMDKATPLAEELKYYVNKSKMSKELKAAIIDVFGAS